MLTRFDVKVVKSDEMSFLFAAILEEWLSPGRRPGPHRSPADMEMQDLLKAVHHAFAFYIQPHALPSKDGQDRLEAAFRAWLELLCDIFPYGKPRRESEPCFSLQVDKEVRTAPRAVRDCPHHTPDQGRNAQGRGRVIAWAILPTRPALSNQSLTSCSATTPFSTRPVSVIIRPESAFPTTI